MRKQQKIKAVEGFGRSVRFRKSDLLKMKKGAWLSEERRKSELEAIEDLSAELMARPPISKKTIKK